MQEGTAEYVTKMWRIALRSLYASGGITYEEFVKCFEKDFLGKEPLSTRETQIVSSVNTIMSDTGSFTLLVKQDIDWITKGVISVDKVNFFYMWLSAIMECEENEIIDTPTADEMLDKIEFDNNVWEQDETEATNFILDRLRMAIIKKNPNAFEFMENPSFDVLMFVNGMNAE